MEVLADPNLQDETMRELYEASYNGCVSTLNTLIQRDPLILSRVSLYPFIETPLHIASLLGHLDFCQVLLNMNPSLASEVNSEGRCPLHLASAAKGHTEVVKALLLINPDICLIRDKDDKLPLHFAAMRGRLGAIQELVDAKPDSIREMTDTDNGSVLHLCVRYNHLEVLKFLVESVRGDSQFLSAKDNEDNTVLHLAVKRRQIKTIKYLLSLSEMSTTINALNRAGLTALDMLERCPPRDFIGLAIEHILTEAGVQRSANIVIAQQPATSVTLVTEQQSDLSARISEQPPTPSQSLAIERHQVPLLSITTAPQEALSTSIDNAQQPQVLSSIDPAQQPAPLGSTGTTQQPTSLAGIGPVQQPLPLSSMDLVQETPPSLSVSPLQQPLPSSIIDHVQQSPPLSSIDPQQQTPPSPSTTHGQQPQSLSNVNPLQQLPPSSSIDPTQQPTNSSTIDLASQPHIHVTQQSQPLLSTTHAQEPQPSSSTEQQPPSLSSTDSTHQPPISAGMDPAQNTTTPSSNDNAQQSPPSTDPAQHSTAPSSNDPAQPSPTSSSMANVSGPQQPNRWTKFDDFYRKYLLDHSDWINQETRGLLMVVATVLATMTFQSTISPPGGVWQEDTLNGSECTIYGMCKAGTAVVGYGWSSDFLKFIFFNTSSFFSSLCVVLLLISGFPLSNKVITWILTFFLTVALSCMMLTYMWALALVCPDHIYNRTQRLGYLLVALWACILLVVILIHIIIPVVYRVRSSRMCRRIAQYVRLLLF